MKRAFLLLLLTAQSYGMIAELKKKFEKESAAAKADEQKIAEVIRHPTIVAEQEIVELEDQVAQYVADRVALQVRELIKSEMKQAFAKLT